MTTRSLPPSTTIEQSADMAKEDPILAVLRAVKDDFQGPDRITPIIAKFKNDLREYDQLQEDVQKRSHEHIKSNEKNLSRQLALLRESSTREKMDPESVHHDEMMIQYDREVFAKANAIQGLEQDISSLEAQIQKLKLQALRLDSGADPENLDDPTTSAVSGPGATTTKAMNGVVNGGGDTFEKRRSLSARTSRTGQELEEMVLDASIETEMTRAEREQAATVLKLHLYRTLGVELVEDERGNFSKARIRSKSDVHLVKFDEELSPFFQTNLLWDLSSK